MRLKDYSKWNCPFCKKPGIVAIGEAETGVNDPNDGGNGKKYMRQLFDHPHCEKHDQFKGFYHDILESE